MGNVSTDTIACQTLSSFFQKQLAGVRISFTDKHHDLQRRQSILMLSISDVGLKRSAICCGRARTAEFMQSSKLEDDASAKVQRLGLVAAASPFQPPRTCLQSEAIT